MESTLREFSRIALTSLIFTGFSLALLAVLRLIWPHGLVDTRAWLKNGQHYVADHLLVVAFTLSLEVIVACLFALAAAEITSRHWRANISPFGVWYQVLRQDRPDGCRPWITLHLTDGTEVTGILRHYTESKILEDQEIAIGGPYMKLLSPSGALSDIGTNSDAVVVRGENILYMIVRYQDRDGQLVRRRSIKPKASKQPSAPIKVSESVSSP